MRKDSAMRALVVLTQPPLAEGGAPGKTAVGLLRGLVGHGVEVRAIAARRAFSAPLDGPPTAGLIGTADWPPTKAAIDVLLREVWPEVRRRVPDARLVLAGRGTDELGLPDAPDTELLGEVASARELFLRFSLLLFPVPRGSGMKVKVLEALASGVPVVTTPAGAEGIADNDGVLVHGSPEKLAEAAGDLLLDERARRECGSAARETFERHYSPAPATEPLV